MPTAAPQHLAPDRVANKRCRLKCPWCAGTCTRTQWAGTPSARRVNVECAYCSFSQLVEIPRDGGPARLAAPQKMDPGEPLRDGALPRMPFRPVCIVPDCRGRAAEAALCEAHHLEWRLAGRPEPREHWAQSGARRTQPPTKEPSMATSNSYHSLNRGEKMTFTMARKLRPDLTVEQWIADGKPRSSHYAAAKKPGPRTARQAAPKPAPSAFKASARQDPAEILPARLDRGASSVDVARQLFDVAAARGARCRVVILDLDFSGSAA